MEGGRRGKDGDILPKEHRALLSRLPGLHFFFTVCRTPVLFWGKMHLCKVHYADKSEGGLGVVYWL